MKKYILFTIGIFATLTVGAQCVGITATGTSKAKVFKSCYDTVVVASNLNTLTADTCTFTKITVTAPIVGSTTGNPTTASSSAVTGKSYSYNLACWGGSVTAASNLTSIFTNSYPSVLATLTGQEVYNGGIGGQTSTQIKDRFISNTDRYKNSVIIWAGMNNFADTTTVLNDIATMVAALGHTRYLVLSVINSTSEPTGTAGYRQINYINTQLSSTYGSNYLNVRAYLVSQYNPGIPADVTDHTNDVPPTSLRTDGLHLTATGYSLVANYIYSQKASVIFPTNTTVATVDDGVSLYHGYSSGAFKNTLSVAGGGVAPPMNLTLVTNGTFTSSLTGWTAGANWSSSSNKALHTVGSTATLTQSITLENAALYYVSFEVSGSTAGTVTISFGSLLGSIATTAASNTTYYYSYLSTGASAFTFTITPTSTFDGSIDNVIVRKAYNLINATPPIFSLNNTDLNDTARMEFRASQSSMYNYSIGYQSLNNNIIGKYNHAFGPFSLMTNITGSYNIANGYNALRGNVSGEKNIAIGYRALTNNVSGSDHIAIGYNALAAQTSGQFNIAIGETAMLVNTVGIRNVGIGFTSLGANVSGNYNTCVGYATGGTATGSGNTLIGSRTGFNISTGQYNVIMGAFVDAPSASTSGQLNIGNVLYGLNLYQTASASSSPTASGAIGVLVSSPSKTLEVGGTGVKAPQFWLSALNTAPSNASDTGTLGEIRIDASYIYICTATNTWKRVAIATW